MYVCVDNIIYLTTVISHIFFTIFAKRVPKPRGFAKLRFVVNYSMVRACVCVCACCLPRLL